MPSISVIHPDNIRFLSSKTIELLKSSHDPFFGSFDVLDKAREGEGKIYEVKHEDEICGVFYLKYRFNHLGKVMELQNLAGELELFKADLSVFLWDLARKEKIDDFVYIGRRGFGRKFPWLEEVGAVFRCRVKQ